MVLVRMKCCIENAKEIKNMEIKDMLLDELIEFIELMPKNCLGNTSIRVGEYKGYTVRVALVKSEENEGNRR